VGGKKCARGGLKGQGDPGGALDHESWDRGGLDTRKKGRVAQVIGRSEGDTKANERKEEEGVKNQKKGHSDPVTTSVFGTGDTINQRKRKRQ